MVRLTDETLVIGPAVFLVAVIVSAIFYYVQNGWDMSTCIFFSTQTLLGCNYSGPIETDVSKFYTLGLYIIGTTLIAGGVSVFSSEIANKAFRVPQYYCKDELEEFNREPFWWRNATFLCLLLWLGVGVGWGVWHEGFPFWQAVYFAVGALSARGDPEPLLECNYIRSASSSSSSCNLGLGRSIFFTVYCLIGVNLYLFFMSKFAGFFCERAVRSRELRTMNRPLSQSELDFALSLSLTSSYSPSSSFTHIVPTSPVRDEVTLPPPVTPILRKNRSDHGESSPTGTSLGLQDFIILELLRLGRVDREFIEEIRDFFSAIDSNGNGRLEAADIRNYHRTYYYGAADPSDQTAEEIVDNDKGVGEDDGERDGVHTSAEYNRLFLPMLKHSASAGKKRRKGDDDRTLSASRGDHSPRRYHESLASPGHLNFSPAVKSAALKKVE